MENEMIINKDNYNQKKELDPNYLQEPINKVIHL